MFLKEKVIKYKIPQERRSKEVLKERQDEKNSSMGRTPGSSMKKY